MVSWGTIVAKIEHSVPLHSMDLDSAASPTSRQLWDLGHITQTLGAQVLLCKVELDVMWREHRTENPHSSPDSPVNQTCDSGK